MVVLKAKTPRAADDEKRCATCKKDKPRGAMLRFVAGPDGKLLWDARERAPGRGVRFCAQKSCLQKRKLWTPEFRAQLEEWTLDQLGLYRRQNRLSVGADTVESVISRGEAGLVLVTEDAADRTRKHMVDAVEKANAQRGDAADWVRSMKALAGTNARDDAEGGSVTKSVGTEIALVILPCTMQRLGRALGRDSVGVVALARSAGATMKDGTIAARSALLGSNGDRDNG